MVRTNSGSPSSTQEPVPVPGKKPSVDRALAEDVDVADALVDGELHVGVAGHDDREVADAVLDRGCGSGRRGR